jgi:hypothetical protein
MNSTTFTFKLGAAAALATWACSISVAFAGQREAETCASQLSTTGQMMFHAVAPYVKPQSDIRELMRRNVKPLVLAGRISREDARNNAQPAGKCLLLLKDQ